MFLNNISQKLNFNQNLNQIINLKTETSNDINNIITKQSLTSLLCNKKGINEINNLLKKQQYNIDFINAGKISNPSSLNPNEVAFPCGLKAKSFFEDKIDKFTISTKEIKITTKDIAYKADIDSFSKVKYDQNKHWHDINDEQFMIWMRISPFENPRKLWGKIENDDIPRDSYIEVKINHRSSNSAAGKNDYINDIVLSNQ